MNRQGYILTSYVLRWSSELVMLKGPSGQRMLMRSLAGGGQRNVIPTSPEHCSRLQQSRCRAVVEDWMIPFAVYTLAEIPNAQLQKLPLTVWDLDSDYLGPTWVPKWHLDWISRFCTAHPCHSVANTQTHTHHILHAKSAAIGRIYATHVVPCGKEANGRPVRMRLDDTTKWTSRDWYEKIKKI